MAPSTVKSQWWSWVARQRIDPHLPIHGLRDPFATWVYEEYGVKQAQEWLGHSDAPAAFIETLTEQQASVRGESRARMRHEGLPLGLGLDTNNRSGQALTCQQRRELE